MKERKKKTNNETKHQPSKIEDEAHGKERNERIKKKTITSSYKKTSLVHCSIWERPETVSNTKEKKNNNNRTELSDQTRVKSF